MSYDVKDGVRTYYARKSGERVDMLKREDAYPNSVSVDEMKKKVIWYNKKYESYLKQINFI